MLLKKKNKTKQTKTIIIIIIIILNALHNKITEWETGYKN